MILQIEPRLFVESDNNGVKNVLPKLDQGKNDHSIVSYMYTLAGT